jgi:hypothetical protein
MAKGEQVAGETRKKGPASFCVPRTAIDALLDAEATAYEICAYLILAQFTEATGVYSSASVKAISTYTGGNKKTIEKAIKRLLTIRAKKVEKVSNGRSGKSHALVEQPTDLGPILYTAEGWLEKTGEILPNGSTERAAIRHVLPDFGEPIAEQVWFGSGLVKGHGTFAKPLKKVKDGGDVVARLLLAMYAETDMEGWGGVNPHTGPWVRYAPMGDGDMRYAEATLHGGGRMIFGKEVGKVSSSRCFGAAWKPSDGLGWWKSHEKAGEPCWRALDLLESSGLFYKVVLVLNRNGEKRTFSSGGEYLDIPDDAEPLYELGASTEHGYAPDGEHGLRDITTNTAGKLGRPVGVDSYAAIVRRGQGAMIVGIFRPLFRVANPKNDGVIRTWSRIRENNAEAIEFIHAIRAANGLEEYPMPKAKKTSNPTAAAGTDMPVPTDDHAARSAQIDALMDSLTRSKRVAPASREEWEE